MWANLFKDKTQPLISSFHHLKQLMNEVKMIHPWQTFSAHGSTRDVAHMRYTLVQLVHSLLPRLSTCILQVTSWQFLVWCHFYCDCVHLTGVSTWMGTPWVLPSPVPCALRGPLSDSRRTGGGQSAVLEAPLPMSWDISSTWVMMKTLVSCNFRLEHFLFQDFYKSTIYMTKSKWKVWVGRYSNPNFPMLYSITNVQS